MTIEDSTNRYKLNRRGLMFILSSPSGAGKTTISRALVKNNDDLLVSISATTRSRRAGESGGQDYHFLDVDQFNKMIESGEMLEHAEVFGNYYGTPRKPVEKALNEGKDVIFDIDWQGTQQLKQVARDDLVTLFILPPCVEELEKRLRLRAKDTRETEEQILNRMSKASGEISRYDAYDYILINDDIDKSIKRAQTILDAERQKRHRMTGLPDFVRDLQKEL